MFRKKELLKVFLAVWKSMAYHSEKSLARRIRLAIREKGLVPVIRLGARRIFVFPILQFYYNKLKAPKKFVFLGKEYKYFYHARGCAWESERTIEVPIIWNIVKDHKGKQILEVGNVLSNYFKVDYDILDKYEIAKSVINEDVVSFNPNKKYDLIVSISTIEHVGWDETPRESDKILRAIKNLQRLLAPGGKIVVTLPLGFNSDLDNLLKAGKIKFTNAHYLKRISANNDWKEASWEDVKDAKYGAPFLNANAMLIGVIENNSPIKQS